MSLTDTKTIAEIFESVATVAALLVGGVWTYFLFVRNRLGFPKVQILVDPQVISIKNNKRLVHISLTIKNIGNVVFVSDYAELRLRVVVPFPTEIEEAVEEGFDIVREGENRVEWPLLASREWSWSKNEFEIEPYEEETLHCDFVIDQTVDVVEFYCFVRNKKKKDLGWTSTRVLKIDQKESGSVGKEIRS